MMESQRRDKLDGPGELWYVLTTEDETRALRGHHLLQPDLAYNAYMLKGIRQ